MTEFANPTSPLSPQSQLTSGDREFAQAQAQLFKDAATELGLSSKELQHRLTELRKLPDGEAPHPGSVKEWVIIRMQSIPLPTRKNS